MLMLSLMIIVITPLRVDPDIGYFMDAARRIVSGDLPYVDFFSENLLTIKFLHVLPVAIADKLNINALSVWLVLNWIGSVASVACAYALSWRIFPRRGASHLTWLFPMCISLISCLALFTADYGQREHIFVLASIPWLLCRFCKSEGIEVRKQLAAGIGIAAGLAATIKPHFLFVLIAVELFWTFRGNKSIDPGLAGFLLFPICNAVYFVVFPVALVGLIKWIVPYSAFGRPDLQAGINVVSFIRFIVPSVISTLAFLLALFKWKGANSRLLGGIAVFSCASGAIVLLQSMRQFYRLMPLFIGVFAIVGLVFLMREVVNKPSKRQALSANNIMFGLIPIVVVLLFIARWHTLTTVPISTPRDLQAMLLNITEPGDDILFLTQYLGVKQPWLQINHRNEANSILGIWKPQYQSDDEAKAAFLSFQLGILSKDIERSPDAIVVSRDAGIKDVMRKHGLIEIIEQRYKFVGEVKNYEVYAYFEDQ